MSKPWRFVFYSLIGVVNLVVFMGIKMFETVILKGGSSTDFLQRYFNTFSLVFYFIYINAIILLFVWIAKKIERKIRQRKHG